MQSAGEALARACKGAPRVAFLCGKGNNGGDGFVAARHLALAGVAVTVYLTVAPAALTGAAAAHFAPLVALGVTVLPSAKANLGAFDLLVDCLLGTGSRGAPTGAVAEAITAANASGVSILACDLPSGVSADTGKVEGVAIQARETLTLAALKPGLLLYPGAAHAGKVTVAEIGLPWATPPTQSLTTTAWVRSVLPRRTQGRDANKGSFGKVLVLAGSRGMVGAAVLTATAALRAGAGLVQLALPESLVPVVAPMAPELVLKPLPETPDGTHGGEGAEKALESLVAWADALAVGPGLTTHPAVGALLASLPPKPLVLDADGLNLLAKGVSVAVNGVLTPHPTELARLMGATTEVVQANRQAAVGQAAAHYNAVTLLKGARTLIAEPSGSLYYNREGSVALATAGSGDVLTGVIAALLASGLSASDAARAGAFLHARAGELAEQEIGASGVLASEIRDRIPAARRELEEGRDVDG